MEQEVIQQTAEGFIGKYGWLLLAGAATIIFKDIVSQFAAGLTIWFSKEYTPDDIVLISGRKAFQRPIGEGVELLNAIQDVYLDDSVSIA